MVHAYLQRTEIWSKIIWYLVNKLAMLEVVIMLFLFRLIPDLQWHGVTSSPPCAMLLSLGQFTKHSNFNLHMGLDIMSTLWPDTRSYIPALQLCEQKPIGADCK